MPERAGGVAITQEQTGAFDKCARSYCTRCFVRPPFVITRGDKGGVKWLWGAVDDSADGNFAACACS